MNNSHNHSIKWVSMNSIAKRVVVLLFLFSKFYAQESETDRLMKSELKMTFPGIYFKHKSASYAAMPYSVDSCFKYIALHFDKNVNSMVIWRDSAETEALTYERIKLLKQALKNYLKTKRVVIYSMESNQKVSRHTINRTADSTKIKYLLSLNSVFDVSKTRLRTQAEPKKSHLLRPKIWCWDCWRHGFHLGKRGREARRMARRNRQKS